MNDVRKTLSFSSKTVFWTLLSFFCFACVEVGRDPGATKEEALQIEAYALASQGLEPARKHVLSAWERLSQAPTFEAFKDMLRGRVLPSVEAYLTALEGVVSDHQELKKAHGALVESYGRFVRDLRTLNSKVLSRSPEEMESDLRKLLLEARQAQAVYQQDMSMIYASGGYRLVVDEPNPEKLSPAKK